MKILTTLLLKSSQLFKLLKDATVQTFVKPSFVLDNYSGGKTVCLVLAGYKEFLWEVVFNRLKLFCPDDVEICIVSSGVFSEKLKRIAEENAWTYMYFKHNCVPQVLNSAMDYFSNVRRFFKIDEDVFVTKGSFQAVREAYYSAQDKYCPGFSAPLIPINGFGYSFVLKKFGKTEEYAHLFEQPKICAGVDQRIESDPDAAIYMWEKLGGNIDELNRQININGHEESTSYLVCPIRFSIGFIYFDRGIFERFGYFPVMSGNGMGMDEEYLCSLAIKSSRPIIVSNRTIVGHLSFGAQNKRMEDYFRENKSKFVTQ